MRKTSSRPRFSVGQVVLLVGLGGVTCFLLGVMAGYSFRDVIELSSLQSSIATLVARPTVPPPPTATLIPTRAFVTPTPDRRSRFERCVQSNEGVRYVIVGNGVTAVSLTWQNDTGGTDQGDYRVPFCKSYFRFRRGDFLYISAQIIRPTSYAGSIECRIYDGETIIARGHASGFAAIATCSGSKR